MDCGSTKACLLALWTDEWLTYRNLIGPVGYLFIRELTWHLVWLSFKAERIGLDDSPILRVHSFLAHASLSSTPYRIFRGSKSCLAYDPDDSRCYLESAVGLSKRRKFPGLWTSTVRPCPVFASSFLFSLLIAPRLQGRYMLTVLMHVLDGTHLKVVQALLMFRCVSPSCCVSSPIVLKDMEVDQEQIGSFGVLLKQGAEARVFESVFVGRKSIVKERFSKKYRHPSVDSKLTFKRLNAEARCMTKARKLGVPTPVLYAIDPLLHTLTFEFVEGQAVKDILIDFGLHGINEELMDAIAAQIGDVIGKLHDGGLVHGDLTTSNMIIRKGTNQLVLIDFGLSFTSTIPEDKAVDLYVLERALLSMHSSCGNVMDRILSSYRKSSKQWSSTLNKLAQVRLRGRKRTMVG
ncbi:hypothetical protein HPP92_017097 [Vanilla planifolia]|uniref:non-specific serine/threonine protein kinase n=1 Tax=Vanilla planifolia TaxID=51239 RepID=A0A835ULM4_VANPL|nr:hypothetical protein HPP92_017097 [Vanilla planifolia]